MAQEQLNTETRETNPYKLYKSEIYWRDLYNWLLEEGYRLRPRYNPEWVPSWVHDKTTEPVFKEDYQVAVSIDSALTDATRVKDGAHVFLKRLDREEKTTPEEVDILAYFSQEALSSDPENHSVPLLARLEPPAHPRHIIIAMPVLRPYHDPDFDTVGEGLEFIRQIFEGFAFLHRHRVAHRGIRSENIMIDARGLYEENWFPQDPEFKSDFTGPIYASHTRTEHPPRYYIIDYGFSRQFREDELPVFCVPKLGSDVTVPEFLYDPDEPCDPFAVDVYTLGNLIKMDFMDGNPDNYEQNGRYGFEFLRPLVNAMTGDNPKGRITMAVAVARLDEIIVGLSNSTLRSQAVRIPGGFVPSPDLLQRAYQTLMHWSRRLSYTARRMPPMPTRTPTKSNTDSTGAPPPRRNASVDARPPVLSREYPLAPQDIPPPRAGSPDIRVATSTTDALPESQVSASPRLPDCRARTSPEHWEPRPQYLSLIWAIFAAILAVCRWATGTRNPSHFPRSTLSTFEQPSVRSRTTGHDILYESEVYWRELYTWLLQEGYRLRPRYSPDWVPSWAQDEGVVPMFAEDYQIAASFGSDFIDATRVKDDVHVFLKRLDREGNIAPEEVDILKYFSEEPISSDQENHCIPLLACLEPPMRRRHIIVAMPVLRPYHDPEFDTVGEGLDFIRQVFEGFSFLHRHRVAHRDIRSENIMMDARGIYTEKWFPQKIAYKTDYSGRIYPSFTRTEHPPRYYIIDFGFSRQFREDEMPASCIPKPASDMTVPEILNEPNEPCDPFPIDVYTLGNLIRMDFMDGKPDHFEQNGRQGFECLRHLVTAMTPDDPKDRITMAEAVEQLDEIIQGLPISTLRSQVIRLPGGIIPSPSLSQRAYQTLTYWARRFSYFARGIPPMPSTPAKRHWTNTQTWPPPQKAFVDVQPPASPSDDSLDLEDLIATSRDASPEPEDPASSRASSPIAQLPASPREDSQEVGTPASPRANSQEARIP